MIFDESKSTKKVEHTQIIFSIFLYPQKETLHVPNFSFTSQLIGFVGMFPFFPVVGSDF